MMKSKQSAIHKGTFFSFLLVFLLTLWITAIPAFSETLIEANIQDTFYISPDGITIEKQIEHCGRLGADIREKLAKQVLSQAAVAPVPRTGLVTASKAKQSLAPVIASAGYPPERVGEQSLKNVDSQNISPGVLPTQSQLDDFSNKLLTQWRKELPFSSVNSAVMLTHFFTFN